MKNKFKVGDRVENISACYKGMKATIIETDKEGLPYHIKFDDNTFLWELEDHLKLIPSTMKNIKDLGEKVAIQCKTQEEWDWVSKELGYKWICATWGDSNSGINASRKAQSDISYYKQIGFTIVQASDFMPSTVNQRIEQLEKELADLKESVRPKKKIEFVKYLSIVDMELKPKASDPKDYDNVELLQNNGKYDIIKAWNNISDPFIFLGHFNDGEK